MNSVTPNATLPKWFWVVAALGLAWNVFGLVQFLSTTGGTVQSLMSGGLTRQQAELYVSLPMWMTVSFAAGVFGGVAACLLLLMRRALAVPVFWVSLVAYGVLYVGDVTQGVFAAFGTPQIIILTTVVLVAVGLLLFARRWQKRGLLK